MSAPHPAPPRLATVLSWTTGHGRQRYVTHVAVADKTLCGLELADRRVQAPGQVTAEPCEQCTRRRR